MQISQGLHRMHYLCQLIPTRASPSLSNSYITINTEKTFIVLVDRISALWDYHKLTVRQMVSAEDVTTDLRFFGGNLLLKAFVSRVNTILLIY